MEARLCALILFLCYSVKAQLPVVQLPQLNNAVVTTPQTLGARYWWVSSDLTTNVNVTNWVDRIQSFVFTNGDDSLRPTNSATGVGFDGSHWLSNTPGFDWETSGAGTASVWVVFSPVTAAAANGGFLASDSSAGSGIYSPSGNQMKNFGDKGNATMFNFVSGNTYDMAITISNIAGQTYNWTNNVFATTAIAGQPNRTAGHSNQIYLAKDGQASPVFFKGKVLELVWFYSNIEASVISQLHTYATNKYGYTP